ncbi:hypothetical protein THTE_4454 [Thermogutta terrifontis]|uniref:Uncharacterized protein n=1 Tax=Thermogutta terrifontis TaxID=1331910 RepID=A0A286RM54_9BACT|nr:hypothetical protein THTE_4454 [Thermogutta terrifontis]
MNCPYHQRLTNHFTGTTAVPPQDAFALAPHGNSMDDCSPNIPKNWKGRPIGRP